MRLFSLHPKLNTLFTQPSFWRQLLLWLLFVLLIGLLAGSASALFLKSLEAATSARNNHRWLIYLLPFGGWLIAWTYDRYGRKVDQGNDLLILTYQQPAHKIPFRMAPMVLITTLLTHLLGGSAGREGTAVQMGGAMADSLRHWLKMPHLTQRVVLLCGIAAGFASVFGTPWAGAVFAVEVVRQRTWPRWAILPIIASAWLAHLSCLAWNVEHAPYHVGSLPAFNVVNLGWLALASLGFGAAAWLFVQGGEWQSRQYTKWVSNAILKTALGGAVLAGFYFLTQNDRYLGLGLPVIQEAFTTQILPYDFALKIAFTTFTLAVGFKGGEVTPLFFIGATLGATLSSILPLPTPFLAAMGFVAVFAGATKCPWTCFFMGMELFGWTAAPFLLFSCGIAALVSGKAGIYTTFTEKDA
jgi:H+/Cl- antiporter ClcA